MGISYNIILVAVFFGYLTISEGVVKYYENKNFESEGAKIVFANPKYIEDATALSSRLTRNITVTYVNVTLLHEWRNNVSSLIQYTNKRNKAQSFHIDLRVCDWMNMTWLTDWYQRVSDIPPVCPIPKASYHLRGVEVPPRRLPFQITPGEYVGGCTFYITKTKEKILEIEISFRSVRKGF